MATFDWLLRLPPDQEQAFWESEPARRVYTTCDLAALAYVVATNSLLGGYLLRQSLPSAAGAALWVHLLAFYAATAAAQLALLKAWPGAYWPWRLHITLGNRLLRLAMLVCVAACFNPLLTPQRHALRARMAACGPRLLCNLRPFTTTLVGITAHSYMVLPFWLALPAQLITLASSLVLIRDFACLFLELPAAHAALAAACASVRALVSSLPVLLVHVYAGSPGARLDNACARAPVVLLLFLSASALLVAPLLATWQLEYRLKDAWLEQQLSARLQQLQQLQPGPPAPADWGLDASLASRAASASSSEGSVAEALCERRRLHAVRQLTPAWMSTVSHAAVWLLALTGCWVACEVAVGHLLPQASCPAL